MKISSIISLIILLGSLTAQNFILDTPDTVRIFAVMVEFQEDKDNATEGDGKFGTIYGKDYGNKILDPLPHDLSYFNNHLEFAKNYFNRVSKGKFTVEYKVLENIVTVSQTMRTYTSLKKDETVEKLSGFSKEVWETADQYLGGIDLDGYDIFAIFHAGVGGDLITPGAIISTRDMPSLYLSKKSLQSVYGNDFQGFPVKNSSKLVTNSMIIPETESREVAGITGSVLLELSINGLIVSSVASHLGLPDLFDTETGKSSIGRFGLMDGQSIFGYSGTFLPEPSAWEKIALGWETPVEISPEDQAITLTSPVIAGALDTTIVKIPINSTEYFLVERRSRDANGDGCKIYFKTGNQLDSINFQKDVDGFYYYDVDSLRGVIVDIDEPDWALPGMGEYYDPETDNFTDLGLLIWHIDESIVSDNWSANTINLKGNRGVKLVEADGVEDIGEEFTTIFGDNVIVEGTRTDSWFAGNGEELYENRLSADTRPNSNSNDGTASLITMSNFSSIAPKMSFDLSFGNESLDPVIRHEIASGLIQKIIMLPAGSNDNYFLIADDLFRQAGNSTEELVYDNFSKFTPVIKQTGNESIVVGVYDKQLNMIRTGAGGFNQYNFTAASNFTTHPVIFAEDNSSIQVAAGNENGSFQTFKINLNDNSISAGVVVQPDIDGPVSYIAANSTSIIFGGSSILSSNYNSWQDISSVFSRIAVTQKNQLPEVIAAGNSKLYKISSSGQLSEIKMNNSAEIKNFILSDIKNDGENYIVFASGNKIYAVNSNGVSADYFPYEDKSSAGFSEYLLSDDFNADGLLDIMAFTNDGRVLTISGKDGELIESMSVSLGDKPSIYPSISVSGSDYYLNVVTKGKSLSRWKILSNISGQGWLSEYGKPGNASSVSAATTSNIKTQYFPVEAAYNWPNPVYEGSTNIRYYVSENSNVNIKIFDLAGDLVDELDDNAVGGIDNETVWNVADIQSGVYFARIKVDSQSSGKSDEKIIKIAIVK